MNRRKPRILIVEDDGTIREVIDEVMREEGYDVRWAATGRQGVAAIEEWRPELMLLDVMLPDMGADELLDTTRRLGGAPPRVVIISATRGLAGVAQLLGADAWLDKPFRLDDVIQTVRKLAPVER